MEFTAGEDVPQDDGEIHAATHEMLWLVSSTVVERVEDVCHLAGMAKQVTVYRYI